MEACACGKCRHCDGAYYRNRNKRMALELIDAYKYGELYAEMRRIGAYRSSLNPETWPHVPEPIDGQRLPVGPLLTTLHSA